jgi:hypothetical protein
VIVLLAVGAAKVVVAVNVMALERYCPDHHPKSEWCCRIEEGVFS